MVQEFLNELPEDAEFDEVMELVESGHFSANQARVLRALDKDDWLGFDYPAQAISAAYKDLGAFEVSSQLKQAIEGASSLYEVEIPDEAMGRMLDWDDQHVPGIVGLVDIHECTAHVVSVDDAGRDVVCQDCAKGAVCHRASNMEHRPRSAEYPVNTYQAMGRCDRQGTRAGRPCTHVIASDYLYPPARQWFERPGSQPMLNPNNAVERGESR